MYVDPSPAVANGPELDELLNDVAVYVLNKWNTIGINLGIAPSKIDAIEAFQRGDPMKCCISVFNEWKKGATRPYTWKTIVNVLESNSVKEMDTAENIRKKYL